MKNKMNTISFCCIFKVRLCLHLLNIFHLNEYHFAHETRTHFVCFKIVCDEDRDNFKDQKNKEKVCEAIYFDSFGIDMPIEVAKYLKNFRPIAYSNRHIQNIHSDVCGWYCLLFDYALEHKQMDDSYVEDFERFLNNWSDNTITNTKLLKSIFKDIP